MFHSVRRTRSVTLAIALAALAACVDEPFPYEPGQGPDTPAPIAPRFAAGDIYLVSNTNDAGIGSLRWALSHATGGEIIRFDPSLAGQTITLDSVIKHDHPVTIEGPAGKGITLSGGGRTRIFEFVHPSPPSSTLRNLTIRDGRAPAAQSAGGIYSGGSLVLEHVTLHGNVADGTGAFTGSNLKLINSTVSGNTSTAGYPAISGSGRLELINSTVAGNSSGGVSWSSSFNSVVLRNSIIASNGSEENCNFAYSTVTREGRNLSDDDSCGGPGEMLIADPMLEPLADNGGPGMTHALPAGSPAIGAALACTVQVDQRYIQRDAACDIGAFEFIDHTTIDLTVDASASVNQKTGWAVVTGTVRCSRDETFAVAVELKQSQRAGRTPVSVTAVGSTPVSCGAAARPWSVALAPSTGSFETGSADVSATTEDTPGWANPASASRAVKLFWSKK